MSELCGSHILNITSYIPGKSLAEAKKEYGLSDFIKLASNENPLGPSPLAILAAEKVLHESHMYPGAGRIPLKEALVERFQKFGIEQKHIVLGNGSNELIWLLALCFLGKSETLLYGWPSFVSYRIAAQALGVHELGVPLTQNLEYDLDLMADLANRNTEPRVKMVFIANPNNPTGSYISKIKLAKFLHSINDELIVVLDEAYAEYVTKDDYESGISYVLRRPRTVILRTFSKIFGLAGLRIGYLVGDPKIVEILHKVRDPFNVNVVAQAAAKAVLGDTKYEETSRRLNQENMQTLVTGLNDLQIPTTPSAGNFVLAHISQTMPDVPTLTDSLLRKGIIVRQVANYDLPHAIRITVGTSEQVQRLLSSLKDVLRN